MSNGIKQISKNTAEKLISCYDGERSFELSILFLNGNVYDINEVDPENIAQFVQLERYKKIAKHNDK